MRSNDGRPVSSSATISPSTKPLRPLSISGRSASSPYCAVTSRFRRESSFNVSPSMYASVRTPSHFTSNIQSGESNDSPPDVASIGSISGGGASRSSGASRALRKISQFFGSPFCFVCTMWYSPLMRSPWMRIVIFESVHSRVSYVPASKIRTSPAPYSPSGMLPSKPPYSSG